MQSVLVIVFVTMQSVPYDPTKQVQMQFTTKDFHRPPIYQYFRSETKERIYEVISTKKCIWNLAGCAILNIQTRCITDNAVVHILPFPCNLKFNQKSSIFKNHWKSIKVSETFIPAVFSKIPALASFKLQAFSNSIKSFLYSFNQWKSFYIFNWI